MSLIIHSLACLLFTTLLIQSIVCASPAAIEPTEFEDFTSLWNQLPSLLDEMEVTVSRFRCPKGWKRLGGSCYYLSNYTSISSNVNHTCNRLHSNYSNLMQIRHAVELFYAAHVLSTNGLTTLIIDIHPDLLKGKKITDILKNDQDRWNRMKQTLRGARVKYQNLTKRIITRLNSAGLKILRRSRRIKPHRLNHSATSTSTGVQIGDEDDDYDDEDDYEYDDFESSDESDDFEEMNDIRGLCDQVHWNVLDDNATSYILSTYSVSDKMICSLSDVESDSDYHYVCEYVIDFCFASIVCGTHGHCVNTLSGFKCSCSFLYGGFLSEKFSHEGRQLLIGALIGVILFVILKPIRSLLSVVKKCRESSSNDEEATESLLPTRLNHNNDRHNCGHPSSRITDPERLDEVLLTKTRKAQPLVNPIKFDTTRAILIAVLTILVLSLSYSSATLRYYNSFNINTVNDNKSVQLLNDTIRLVRQCQKNSDYRRTDLLYLPIAICLIFFFSCATSRTSPCAHTRGTRPALFPPLEPFRTVNRFTTATVFGIVAFQILKFFEEVLFGSTEALFHGVIFEIVTRIGTIVIVGFRYYPILISLRLRNILVRFLACLYIVFDVTYTILREGSCMGFITLSKGGTVIEEAKLRMELGAWFILYGLAKYTPHFFFLSYLTAELCVRFVYDSMYLPLKKKENIWSTPQGQLDEVEYAKYYTIKLFRDDLFSTRRLKEQKKVKRSRMKKILDYIYLWDEDFHFTTMVICTYTIAIVFLYYLACTFIFLYFSRTIEHISLLRSSIESSANVEMTEAFSLRIELILSIILTVIIYGFQLFIGLRNHKRYIMALQTSTVNRNIPSIKELEESSIVQNSVHYSGFLVGYMGWGFVICFHLIFLILTGIGMLPLKIHGVHSSLSIITPILVAYCVKRLSADAMGKFIFIRAGGMELRNHTSYAIFIYFNFFADCFLGIVSCIVRLVKATLLNLLFMGRLDHSFMGNLSPKFDAGYKAYFSYLHMEIKHTHPIKKAFCYTLCDAIHLPLRRYYDDDCCAPVYPSDDSGRLEEPEENQTQQNETDSVVNRRQRENESDESCELQQRKRTNTPLHLHQNYSSIFDSTERTKRLFEYSINDDALVPSITDLMSKIQSSDRTATSDKDKQSKVTNSNNPNDTLQVNKNDSSSMSRISSGCVANTQQTLPSKQEESDDDDDNDGGISIKKIVERKQRVEEKKRKKKEESIKKKQSHDTRTLTDDDEDGCMQKPKPKVKEMKPKRKSILSQCFYVANDDEDEDGAMSKQKSSTDDTKKKAEKKTKKESSQSSISAVYDEDEDEDGGRIIKTYDTIKKIMPSIRPSLDHPTITEDLSSSTTVDNTTTRLGPEESTNNHGSKVRETADKRQQNTSRTDTNKREEEEETTVSISTADSSSSNMQTSNQSTVYLLRTLSYTEALGGSPPTVPQRPKNSFLSSKRKKTNNKDDNSSHSKATDNAGAPTSFFNRFYSIVELIQSVSHHPKPQLSVQTVTEPDQNKAIEEEKKKKQKRQQARNRWYLAYTLINNWKLFPLRKNLHNRVLLVRSTQNSIIEDRLLRTGLLDQPSEATSLSAETETLRRRRMKTEKITIPEQQSAKMLLLVPAPNYKDYPRSPVEQYIAVYSQVLYNADNLSSLQVSGRGISQQENISPSLFQPVSSTVDSETDNPVTPTSSIARSTILRSQMSHSQHMSAWRENEIKKYRKRRPHRYTYGPALQRRVPDKASTTVILTPVLLPVNTTEKDTTERTATQSPFQFPDTTTATQTAAHSIKKKSRPSSRRQKTPVEQN